MTAEIGFYKRHSDAIIPKKAHEDDACFDLFSAEDGVVNARNHYKVNTGISWQPLTKLEDEVWCLQIEGRSGVAANYGIDVFGGIADQGYRGILYVILYNSSSIDFYFKKGAKIAQAKIIKLPKVKAVEIKELDTETERGENGLGSTG